MIFTIEEAREYLRLDGYNNDEIIYPLIEAIPTYLEHTTGYTAIGGTGGAGDSPRLYSPLAKTAARFILQQWYYGENADSDKLQRLIDCLLKALAAERVTA